MKKTEDAIQLREITPMEKITVELLREWNACQTGIKKMAISFPNGATLQEIADVCMKNNWDSDAVWLFNKCRSLDIFIETVSKGYRNSGNYNTGHHNSGNLNSGHFNSGNYNSGYHNSGYHNSGNLNSGHFNSGDYNSGNYNSGYHNTGDRNTGNLNSGNYNSGYHNTGDRNTGNFNSGNRNTGFFNTNSPKVRMFNIETDLDFNNSIFSELNLIINDKWPPILKWVDESDMTDEEKEMNPSYRTTGGFLKKTEQDYKKCWSITWSKMNEEEKQFIKSLPNFNDEIFKEITGVDVS